METDKQIIEGYTDHATSRVAVNIERYYNSHLNGDHYAYYFSKEAEEFGIDPWQIIDGVDKHTNGLFYDVWFANNTVQQVNRNCLIFVSEKDASVLGVKPKIDYFNMPVCTDEQFDAASAEARRWMDEGKGSLWYSSSKIRARMAVIEYILFTQGLRVKRKDYHE